MLRLGGVCSPLRSKLSASELASLSLSFSVPFVFRLSNLILNRKLTEFDVSSNENLNACQAFPFDYSPPPLMTLSASLPISVPLLICCLRASPADRLFKEGNSESNLVERVPFPDPCGDGGKDSTRLDQRVERTNANGE